MKRVQNRRDGFQNKRRQAVILQVAACLLFVLSCITVFPVYADEYSYTGEKIIAFVKNFYGPESDIKVKLNSIPSQLREGVKVKNVAFAKVPDINGDGVCAVEVDRGKGRYSTVQVPFRVFTKRHLFVLKESTRKGDVLRKGDVYVKETYMNGKSIGHPASIDDVIGRVLKKDLAANTIITYQMLDDSVAFERGDIVNIVAENKNLLVQSKGKAMEKGRLGDIVRVKNMSSGKEIEAKVSGQNTVTVVF